LTASAAFMRELGGPFEPATLTTIYRFDDADPILAAVSCDLLQEYDGLRVIANSLSDHVAHWWTEICVSAVTSGKQVQFMCRPPDDTGAWHPIRNILDAPATYPVFVFEEPKEPLAHTQSVLSTIAAVHHAPVLVLAEPDGGARPQLPTPSWLRIGEPREDANGGTSWLVSRVTANGTPHQLPFVLGGQG
jgi:hypothetical protein